MSCMEYLKKKAGWKCIVSWSVPGFLGLQVQCSSSFRDFFPTSPALQPAFTTFFQEDQSISDENPTSCASLLCALAPAVFTPSCFSIYWQGDCTNRCYVYIYIVIHGLMAHTKRLKCTILAGSFPRLCAVRRKTRTQRWHSHRRTCLKLKLAAGVPS